MLLDKGFGFSKEQKMSQGEENVHVFWCSCVLVG